MSDSAIPWAGASQSPLSMGFPRQEYCNGLLFSSLGDLPKPGIEPMSSALASELFSIEPPEKPHYIVLGIISNLEVI